MDRAAHLAALALDADAFATACAAAGLGAPVATCPGWTVADLLWHMVEVNDFWHAVVADRLPHWDHYRRPTRPVDDALLDRFREGHASALETLASTDSATQVWTWSNDQSVGFVIRRLAHETMIHRWDAEQAAGRPSVLDTSLASDGIDEFLTHFIHDPAPNAEPVAGSVHIHCADVAGEWTIREEADGSLDVTREHAKGDCAIRGAAGDILLALWRRVPLTSLDVVGDSAVAARFVSRPGLG
jgi:uncharacterized protein (TIGR03083 family)